MRETVRSGERCNNVWPWSASGVLPLKKPTGMRGMLHEKRKGRRGGEGEKTGEDDEKERKAKKEDEEDEEEESGESMAMMKIERGRREDEGREKYEPQRKRPIIFTGLSKHKNKDDENKKAGKHMGGKNVFLSVCVCWCVLLASAKSDSGCHPLQYTPLKLTLQSFLFCLSSQWQKLPSCNVPQKILPFPV